MALDFVKMNGGVSKTAPVAKSSGGLDFVKMNEGFADPNAAPVVASASVIKASPREIFTKNPINSENAMSVAPKANAIAARKIFTANPITAGADQGMSKVPKTTISQGRKPVTFKGAVLDTLASDEFAKTGDALMKVPETAGRVLSLPFEAVAKGAEFVQKGVGAIFNPEIYIGKKSIKTAYQEAPTIGGVISEGIDAANYLLNGEAGEKNQQSVPYQFAKEFTKQLADTGVVAGISMPVLGFAGKKLATKSKTYTLTPENVNGKIIYKEPIPKNVIDVLEKGFKDATPDVITEIQKNGLKITIEAPRGPVGEIPAQLLTGETSKKANIKVEIPNFKGGQVKIAQPQAGLPEAPVTEVKPPVAVEPVVNQVVYRTDGKSVVPETKSFNKVVSFDSQVDAIVNMADSGSEKAQNLIANPNNFTEQAAGLLTKTFGKDYDAIQYTNSKEPERGVEYQELSTGNIFSVDKPALPPVETGLGLGTRKMTVEKGAFEGVPITDEKGNIISEPAPKATGLGAYKVGQTIKFDGKEMTIGTTLKVGKENKYKLADEKGKEIWTNEQALDTANSSSELVVGDIIQGKNANYKVSEVFKNSAGTKSVTIVNSKSGSKMTMPMSDALEMRDMVGELLKPKPSDVTPVQSVAEKENIAKVQKDNELRRNLKPIFNTGDSVVTNQGKKLIIKDFYVENGKTVYNVYTPGKKNSNAHNFRLRESDIVTKPKTQKDIVQKAVAESAKTIQQISEETKILEPNVRRILGVGAKEGTFERVDKGVYVLSKNGNDTAWIETANAVESLPRLANKGFKSDMVFLDIPYDTPAVKGGNRGVKYGLLSVNDFGIVLDSIKIIVKNDNSPVIHMYSQAESGMKAMQKYNDLFITKGFKPVGKGEYQKTFADGSPVTSPNGKVAKPEGIIVFTKSGNLDKSLDDLNFVLKRPKGYQTEKPAEMLNAMIEMTTSEGDIVLDPFAGSGVTGAEAIKLGRKPYLIEKNKEVVDNIIKPRIKKEVDNLKPNKLKEALAPVPKIKLTGMENETKARYETGVIDQLSISQAGKRLPIIDNDGYTTGYQGIKSTFPSWLPEEFRLNAVIKPVLEAISNDKTPVKIAEKRLYSYIKEMFDSFDVAEADLGPTLDVADIDFLENKLIKKSYEEAKTNAADLGEISDTKPATEEITGQKEIIPEPLAGIENDINRDVARRAKAWSSFSPEKAGDRYIEEYSGYLTETYNELLSKTKNEPDKINLLNTEFARFRQGYKERFTKMLSAESRTASPMVTGPAGFNNSRNLKRVGYYQSASNNLSEFREKVTKAIENKLEPTKITATGSDAVDQYTEKLNGLLERQRLMKETNAVIRKGVDVSKKVGDLFVGKEEIFKELENHFDIKYGYPSYKLTSINNKIKEAKLKVAKFSKHVERMESGKEDSITFDGGKIKNDYELNRTQILFDSRPNLDMIGKLKRSGFRWSPSNSAWQRQITPQAVRAAKDIVGYTGSDNEKIIKPNDLQAKADNLPAYTGGSDNANIGVFSDGTPIELGSMNKISPIEMPEMVRLARQLTGSAPKIKERMGKKLGYFRPKSGEIYLKSDQFQKGNEEQTAKLLAHEIGHLIDWLPDQTMARGNLLGHLYSLRKFMKSVFGTETGLFGKQQVNLQKMRNDAVREVIKRSNYTYGEYITKKSVREALKPKIKEAYEAAVESSGAIKNSIIKKELMAVSEYWRPYDKVKSSPSYLKYRENPKELYADAISMLLNSPGTLEKKAPTFYREFFAALDNKPDVKADYFELQELLNGSTEKIFAARKEDIRKGFSKAEAIQADFAAKKKLGKQAYWERLRQQLDDINYPIIKKQREAEASGATFKDEDSPKFVLQEQSMVDNENFLLVENIDKNIVKPIEKAGMTTEDIGEYLLLNRIQKDRADIANPFGFNAKNAGSQLDHMKQLVGEDNFKLLEEKAKDFHDLVFKSVEEAVKVGSYNKKMFEEKFLENKYSYAAFQVVDYMQDYMPATVKAQVGTLKEVANPFVSTILKTVALNRLNSLQRAKNSVIKMLSENYADEITETKTISSDGKLSIFKPARDKGSIELLEDGKMRSYDVDPYIAESFAHDKIGDLNVIVELLDKFNNNLFKPMVTTYNLGFAAAFNPIRDFRRNYKIIPNATIGNLLSAYVKSLPQAIKYSKGELDDFTQSLVESKAINAPINDYNFDPREDEIGRILERFGVVKGYEPYNNKVAELTRKAFVKSIGQALERIRFVANTLEIVSKVAGAKVRIAGGESGKSLDYNIRNYTGTPNYKVKGKDTRTTNALFTFSNIMKEGLKSDFQIATNPNTRSGYWWKTVKIDLMPKFLMFLAAAGLAGTTLKKFFDNVTEYDKANYLIIPLGFREGKSVYMRVPHDEAGRLVSAAFWKMANFTKDGDVKSAQDVFALGAGQLPSVNTAISTASGWGQYLSGKNPYDAFRGRGVIDDTTFQAGGGPALKKMVKWTLNNLGLSAFTTYDPSKGDGVEVAVQVLPLVNRLIKISDYGQTEKAKKIQSSIKSDVAKDLLKDREAISGYVNKNIDDYKAGKLNIDQAAAEVTADILGHAIGGQADLDKMKNIKGKLERALKLGKYDPNFDSIIYATSNKEKAELLKAYREDLSGDEYTKLITQLMTEKAISTKVLEMLN